MGTYKRLPRSRPKKIDEFKSLAMHAIEWYLDHRALAARVGAVLLAVAVVVSAAFGYWTHRQQAAAAELYRIHQLDPQSPALLDALRQLVDRYRYTASGRVGAFELATVLAAGGKDDEAIAAFRGLAALRGTRPLLRIAALHAAAELLVKQGHVAEALTIYAEAAADPGNVIAATSRYQQALCDERLGRVHEARELYRKIVAEEKTGASEIKAWSEERLLWLALKG